MVSACLERDASPATRAGRSTPARVQLVPRPEPPAAVALRPVDRRLPRRPARRPDQREPGRRSRRCPSCSRCARCARPSGTRRCRRRRCHADIVTPPRTTRRCSTGTSGIPILTAADWPYPAHTVFNPGATRLPDGTTLLLCRVEDRRGHSHLCAARSAQRRRRLDDRPRADAPPIPSTASRGAVGHRGSAHHLRRGARASTRSPTPPSARAGPGSRWRSPRTSVTSSDAGWSCSPTTRTPRCCRAASTAASRCCTARDRLGRAHLDLVLARTCATGAATSWCCPRAEARGGTPTRSASRRRSSRRPRGWLMLYHGVRHTAAGCLYRLGARSSTSKRRNLLPRCAATPGSSVPRQTTSARATSATSRSPAATRSAKKQETPKEINLITKAEPGVEGRIIRSCRTEEAVT